MLQRGVPMLVAFLGYLLLGLGPGAVLFLSIPARRPFLVILTFARCAPASHPVHVKSLRPFNYLWDATR